MIERLRKNVGLWIGAPGAESCPVASRTVFSAAGVPAINILPIGVEVGRGVGVIKGMDGSWGVLRLV